MTNKELANAIINIAKHNNITVDITESQLSKVKKAELEMLYSDLLESAFVTEFDFNVYELTETETEQTAVETEQTAEQQTAVETETEQTAEQPKVTFKKTAASVRNFEQLLDTLTAYNLAVSYTNRRIVTDAMLFCKRAKYIARVYVKNSHETIIDDMLTAYDGYKGYLDIEDNDMLDIVIVALQSATRAKKKRVTKAAADRRK